MADSIPESLQLFNNYLVAVERRNELTTVLADVETVDDNVREAYALADRRLNERVEGYLERTPELIDGAAIMADRAGTAIDQLKVLEGVLTPQELEIRYDRYRAPLRIAAAFMVERCAPDDERLEQVMRTADLIGGIAVQRSVQAAPPDKTPTPITTIRSETIVEQNPRVVPIPVPPTIKAMAGYAAEDASTVAGVERFIAAITQDQLSNVLMPRDIWDVAGITDGVAYNTYRVGSLVGSINRRLETHGKALVHNGRRGLGSRYELVDNAPEAPEAAAPEMTAIISVEAAAPLAPEVRKEFVDYITVQDGLTLATFVRMYSGAIRQMELPVLSTDVLDALLDMESGQAVDKTQDPQAIHASREASFQKIADLATDPEKLQHVLDALPADDPRHAIVAYARQIAPQILRFEPLLKGYYNMQLAVTVGRRSGWEVKMVDKKPLDRHGAELLPREDTTSAAEQAMLAAVAAEESRPAHTRPQPLTVIEQQRIMDEKPLAVLHNLALKLATVTRQNNLRPDRAYSLRRLDRIFPGLAGMQLETRQGTAMVVEAIVHIASQQAGPLGLLGDRSPEDLLRVIFGGVDEAYEKGIQTSTPNKRRLLKNPQPL